MIPVSTATAVKKIPEQLFFSASEPQEPGNDAIMIMKNIDS